jgi:PKD repeat protein
LELEKTMRRTRSSYRLLALAGVLSVVAWGCSTDSPTAPRQVFPPDPPSGQTYFISVSADPGGIVISDSAPTGTESTTLIAEVRVGGSSGPPPPDGTTIQLATSLGSFDASVLVRSTGAALVNGRVFFTLFAGGLPVQLGVATVQATLQNSRGEEDVTISILEADFIVSNPEENLSVDFIDTSKGNPTTFQWDFGDSTGSTLRNPIHIYADFGTYSVRLTITKTVEGVTLTDSILKENIVTITEPPEEVPPPPP